ncbi:MAG: hypothetical protein RJA36_1997 [Pseudomonadota bacterium]|jgi:AcrR family transcriptional regulator
MATPSPAPRRTRRKDARPGELLQAALELFVEKGYAATRVEEVAQRAQVSKGTLFLYFPSKVELFKAVVRANISNLLREWDGELGQFGGSSAELVRLAVLRWWQRVGDTPASGISKLVMSEAGQFPELAAFYEQEVIMPGRALLRRILQRGVERGEFAPMDLEHALYSLLAPMMFLLMWKHSFGPCSRSGLPLDPVAFIESQTRLLLTGLLARQPHQGNPT